MAEQGGTRGVAECVCVGGEKRMLDAGLPEVWLSRDLPQFCNPLTSPSCRKLTGCAAGLGLSGSQWCEAGGSVSK